MKPITRILCLLMVVCMAVFALASCTVEETNTSGGGNVVTQEGFRLEAVKFNTELTVICCDPATGGSTYLSSEIAPESNTGDGVQNAAYTRAQLLEEQYGIKLIQNAKEKLDDLTDAIQLEITSGTGSFDIICAAPAWTCALVTNGYFADLANISENDYIDLSQPYWDQNMTEILQIGGSSYYVTGDALVTDDEATWSIFFNKNLLNDNNLVPDGYDSIYDIVNKGDWTLDMMYEMAKSVAKTDSTTGKMTYSSSTDAVFGVLSQTYDSLMFVQGCGESLTRNENGVPVLTFETESNKAAFDKIFTIMKDKSHNSIHELDAPDGQSGNYTMHLQMFADGKALFMPNQVGRANLPAMRDAQVVYGILPMPKYSKEQERYYSGVTIYWCTAFSMLDDFRIKNPEKFDAACYALEALSYYGQQNLKSKYYEDTLKLKSFPDPEAEKMLDIIFANRVFDFGGTYFNSILGFYTGCLFSENNPHTHNAESNRSSYEGLIETFLETVAAAQASKK